MFRVGPSQPNRLDPGGLAGRGDGPRSFGLRRSLETPWGFWLAAVLWAVGLSGPGGAFGGVHHAHAQDGMVDIDDDAPTADEQARELFSAGQAAYDDERYREALRYFERAYRMSDRPRLLYNIGLAQERLGRRDNALESYRRFLEEVPRTSNRVVVEARIETLEEARADEEADEQAERDRRFRDRRDRGRHVDPWSTEHSDDSGEDEPQRDQDEQTADDASGSTGVTLLVVGGIVTLGAVGALVWWLDRVSELGTCNDIDLSPGVSCGSRDDIQTQHDIALGATIGLGAIGIGLMAAGLLLLPSDDDADAEAQLSCVLSPFGAVCTGTF